ncbi:hypothetical protein SAMN05446037_101556 [Anaerovirgula multivorans]|uniref:HEAT repeat-containing protein n=1 Tax=Anaerovirgula multivorans TaxID=312168 RepID=A0A239G481_9FIRM|nr:hypothetical protein [Anaerovirgula multivorans]SNS63931.1 hypothetical protein SAMN05446037_101556 [Anaerovirgula multivorans]
MVNTFFDTKIEKLIDNVEESKKILIEKELEAIGYPETVGALIRLLDRGLFERDTIVNHCFLLIKHLEQEEFFPYILDILKVTDESIYIQYGIRALSTIPKDTDLVRKLIPDIMQIIESATDHKIIYQGVVLLYRISKVHPQLDSLLNRKSIKVNTSLFQDTLQMVNNLDRWEADFHKHSNVRSELNHPDAFFNFANQFMIF